MNDDFEKIEQELKEKNINKKPQKISGKSVFEIERILKERAEAKKENEKESKE